MSKPRVAVHYYRSMQLYPRASAGAGYSIPIQPGWYIELSSKHGDVAAIGPYRLESAAQADARSIRSGVKTLA